MTTSKQSDIFARHAALAANYEMLKLRAGDLLEALADLREAYKNPVNEIADLKRAERSVEAATDQLRAAIGKGKSE